MAKNSQQNVGAGQIRIALAGKDQYGRKLSKEDRQKILRAGGENITRGNALARKKKKGKTLGERLKHMLTDTSGNYANMHKKAGGGSHINYRDMYKINTKKVTKGKK